MGDNTAIIINPKISKMRLTTISIPLCHANISSVSLHTDCTSREALCCCYKGNLSKCRTGIFLGSKGEKRGPIIVCFQSSQESRCPF